MRSVLVSLLVLCLMSVALAGCVDEKASDAPAAPVETEECLTDGLCGADAVLDDAGRDLRTELTAEDSLPAPTWVVGDVFEQHQYYGSADTTGEHIVTMVADDSGSCYTFGTTSQVAARTEAVFDLPILGCIDKQSLATSGFGTDWGWMYDFPLEDGKSWQGEVNGIFNWNQNSFHSYAFTLTAAYDAEVDTPQGDYPGFWITGTTADGEELLRYNYVPAIGWFSHFWMYDLSTEDADDIMFHAMNMGRSTGFTGTYYIDETTTAIDRFYMPPFSVMEGDVPEPTFTVPEGATYLKGVIVPIACVGVSRISLVSPSNEMTEYEHQVTDPEPCQTMASGEGDGPDPRMYSVHWYDADAEAGDWKIASAGAGIHGYYIWLEAVTEVAYELAAADVSDESEAL